MAFIEKIESRCLGLGGWGISALVICILFAFSFGRILAAPATDLSNQFFDPDAVQTIHLEVSSSDLKRMESALPERIFVPAKFRWNDQLITKAAIRYKGDSSSIPGAKHKRGFLVSFTEFQKGQRFLGLRHVALDNGIQFGSLFSERLITDVLRQLGVRASRCNYAKLYLNDRYIGVYVNVERVDQSFLERNFGSSRGVLFKVDQGGPGTDLRYLGEDPTAYRQGFELHAGKDKEAFAGLVELIRSINDRSPENNAWVQHLDMDSFLKTTAVMLFAGAFDQYTGWNPHNYYLYRNPAEQRWSYIPWDMDVGFADNAFDKIPVLAGWNAAWPAPVPGRPLMERIVSDPALLKTYREQAGMILEKWFRPEVLIPRLRALHSQIRADLEQDPFPPRRVTVPSDRGYEDILSSMEAFICQRYALARAQLGAPGSRPEFKPMSASLPEASHPEGPRSGPASADAPTGLRSGAVTVTSVELQWTTRAQNEAAYIVQRCTGADCTEFTNHIGQPGKDITGVTDKDVRPGVTYRYRVYAVVVTPNQGPRATGVSNVITVTVPEVSHQAK